MSQACEASTKSASVVLDFQVLRSVEILTEERANLIFVLALAIHFIQPVV